MISVDSFSFLSCSTTGKRVRKETKLFSPDTSSKNKKRSPRFLTCDAEVCVRGEFQATQYDVSEFSEGKLNIESDEKSDDERELTGIRRVFGSFIASKSTT
jgi:hypothetical protein